MYSMIGSSFSFTVQPAAEALGRSIRQFKRLLLSGLASLRFQNTTGEDVFLPALAYSEQTLFDGIQRNSTCKSRRVTPGCNLPLKRTNTDSGISKRHHAGSGCESHTKPEPAGKENATGSGCVVATGTYSIRQQQTVQPE